MTSDIQRRVTKVPGAHKQPIRLGRRWIVATIASSTSSGISCGRPRPGPIRPTASAPSSPNRARHRRTVLGVAIAQIRRPDTEGHAYYQRCLQRGKTKREATRELPPARHRIQTAMSGAAHASIDWVITTRRRYIESPCRCGSPRPGAAAHRGGHVERVGGHLRWGGGRTAHKSRRSRSGGSTPAAAAGASLQPMSLARGDRDGRIVETLDLDV